MPPELDLEQNFELGPYLQAALICETVIEDKNGVLSAIKIIDRITRTAHGPDPPAVMDPFEYEFFILLVLKSGENPGVFRIKVQPIKPTNEAMPPVTYTMHLEAPADRGMNIIGRTRLRFDVPGLWWFDVLLNERRITRMPLRIIYLPQQVQIGG